MKQSVQRLAALLQSEFGDRPATCTLATTSDSGRATARTMVVRDVSVEGGLLFVSDRRTRKDDDLRSRPLCEVCFWLAKQQMQVRVQGEAVVLDAMNDHGTRESWWDRMDERGILIFTGKRGTPDEVPMPATFELITITPSWITFDNYGEAPPTHETWGNRD